jgi:hypothetical protein
MFVAGQCNTDKHADIQLGQTGRSKQMQEQLSNFKCKHCNQVFAMFRFEDRL